MMLQVRRDVLVVRKRRSERRVRWVREIVIPVQPLLRAVDLIAVGGDQTGVEVDLLSDAETQAIREPDLALGRAGV